MTFDPEKHHRRSIRLTDYDYSQPGAYFVTLCTYKRQCWFGEIENDRMYLNQIGKIVANEWLRTAEIRSNFQLDEWIIMPNHLHGIVIIVDRLNSNTDIVGADNANVLGARNAPLQQKPNSLSSFIAGFKSAVTKQINLLRNNQDFPIWQRNYYESIIRDEKGLTAIREYIFNNPRQWQNDPDNLQNQQHLQELSLDLSF
jgi:REP element-mobilizing transposase RayT